MRHGRQLCGDLIKNHASDSCQCACVLVCKADITFHWGKYRKCVSCALEQAAFSIPGEIPEIAVACSCDTFHLAMALLNRRSTYLSLNTPHCLPLIPKIKWQFTPTSKKILTHFLCNIKSCVNKINLVTCELLNQSLENLGKVGSVRLQRRSKSQKVY